MVDISILIWLVDKTNVELRGTALQGPFEQLVDFAISEHYALVQCHGKPKYLWLVVWNIFYFPIYWE